MAGPVAALNTLLKMGDGGETAVGGGGSTTLAAVALAGATNIKVVGVTGFAIGDNVLIGGAGGTIRELSAVGTAGAGGTGLDFVDPLDYSIPNGSTVVEVADQAFTTIGEVLDISGPQLSADIVDTTSHSNPDAFETKIVTLLRTGNVTFDVNYNPQDASHDGTTGLLFVYVNRRLRSYKLVFPLAVPEAWGFSAYVNNFSQSLPVAGVWKASISLAIAGAPDFNATP